jgi:hypothetical protein
LLRAFTAIAIASTISATAYAQDAEAPSEPSEGYAWGEGEAAHTAMPEDPLRIQAFVGAGAGFRFLRNLDDPFNQDFLVPPYLDFGAAIYLPGGELRNGLGLTLSMNLMQDQGTGGAAGVPAGQQWAIMPAYHLLIPVYRLAGGGPDIVQITAHLGLPIVIGSRLGGTTEGGSTIDVSVGGELGLGVNIKFLAGLGFYLEAQVDVYGGTFDTVHPLLAFDAGFVLDYEVLQ